MSDFGKENFGKEKKEVSGEQNFFEENRAYDMPITVVYDDESEPAVSLSGSKDGDTCDFGAESSYESYDSYEGFEENSAGEEKSYFDSESEDEAPRGEAISDFLPEFDDENEEAEELSDSENFENAEEYKQTETGQLYAGSGINAKINETVGSSDNWMKVSSDLSFEHVTFIDGKTEKRILNDVSFSFETGRLGLINIVSGDDEQRRILMGIIAGFAFPQSGQALIKSTPIFELDSLELRGHRLGLITQKYSLREDFNSIENIVYAMEASGRSSLKARDEIARELLETVGFNPDKTDNAVSELEETDKRLVSLARAMSCSPTVIVADGLTSGLPEGGKEIVLNALRNALARRKRELCIVLVSSGEENLAAACDDVFEIDF